MDRLNYQFLLKIPPNVQWPTPMYFIKRLTDPSELWISCPELLSCCILQLMMLWIERLNTVSYRFKLAVDELIDPGFSSTLKGHQFHISFKWRWNVSSCWIVCSFFSETLSYPDPSACNPFRRITAGESPKSLPYIFTLGVSMVLEVSQFTPIKLRTCLCM